MNVLANSSQTHSTGGTTTRQQYVFEELYRQSRSLENRIYTNSELSRLPDIAKNHPHNKEWAIRKQSCRKLLRYLESQKQLRNIAEPGCGNGWLSHQLASLHGSSVTGLDINTTELEQAALVFGRQRNLAFMRADAGEILPGHLSWDVIIFAASISYFPSLTNIINRSLQQLAHGGELHILDSPFYTPASALQARQRMTAYYHTMGIPGMIDYYFHHLRSELDAYPHTLLYDPLSPWRRLIRNSNPFPWIRIKKSDVTL